jgi:hypothetical protein
VDQWYSIFPYELTVRKKRCMNVYIKRRLFNCIIYTASRDEATVND